MKDDLIRWHCLGRGVRGVPSLLLLLLLIPVLIRAEAVRTQTLRLVPGWNAVYVEVDPPDLDPAIVFAGQPVDVVAAHTNPLRGSQFVNDPRADLQNAYGWKVWYAVSRSDAFLSNLFAIQGGRSYLVHATTNASLAITGAVPPTRVRWQPNAYTFVGFSVDEPGAPTFAQFFGASPAHHHNQIYRLIDGTWRRVSDPAATLMRSGEAFWIYTRGRSDYGGPLDVTAESAFGVTLTTQFGSELSFRNRTRHPLGVTLEHVVEGNDSIPLAIEVRTYDADLPGFRDVTVGFDHGAWETSLPTLEAGRGLRLPLKLQSALADPGTRHSLLRIRTDLGTVTYVPVTAIRDARSATETESP